MSSSTTATSFSKPHSHVHRLVSWQAWLWCGVLGGLFVTLFWPFVWRMIRIATNNLTGINQDWSHALIVPALSGYFVWTNADRLSKAASRVYWPGLLVLFLGMFGFSLGIYPVRNDMVQGYSMIVALFGLVLFLLGPAKMRVLWFPILYLALAVKISDRYWGQIAFFLRQVAAKCATLLLNIIGLFIDLDAFVHGSKIELIHRGIPIDPPLEVADACSGLRMLMAFIALGVAMAYLANRPWWHRMIFLLLTIPVAVLVNVGRVTVIGLISLFNREMASGDFHTFVGLLMLIPAAGLFWLMGWVLDHLVIRDASRVSPGETSTVAHSDRGGQESRADDRPIRLGQILMGLFVGGVLTALIGLEYMFVLAIDRPEDLLGNYLNRDMAMILSVLGLVALVAGGWWVRGLVRDESTVRVGPGSMSFGIGAGVLLMAVIGLNGVVNATQTVLTKKEVPLRRALYLIPNRMGSWEMAKEYPLLSDEMVETLGTKQYIRRLYRDQEWNESGPGGVVDLHIAYYTGTPDTVPHVPERCYIASGLNFQNKTRTEIQLTGPQYDQSQGVANSKVHRGTVRIPSRSFDATIFTFSSPERPDDEHNVIYFFSANGKYLSTPDAVRWHGFDPRDQYSYYCKVEVSVWGVGDRDLATQRVSAFLSEAMPEIMACLPDWVDVTQGRWPED